jgi:hypothetical protein
MESVAPPSQVGKRAAAGPSLPPELPSMEFASLQADVIHHVESVAELVRRALEVLPSDQDTEYQALSNERRGLESGILDSVRRLELRLPVVATMNAGKSTLINAIAGFRLLPYRVLPMTVLPTEVVLTGRVAEPILIVPARTSALLGHIATDLRKRFRRRQYADELAQADAYLDDTIASVNREEDVPAGTVRGLDAINTALTRANDLVRLAVLFGVNRDLLEDLRELPRVECPAPDVLADVMGAGQAELVLVDTPGPNEAGMSAHLLPLIDQAIQQAGVIFLVLNFTEMRSQAQDEIRKQIEPIRDRLGTDKLYVVVNKIDDRRDEDMTPEQTKEFAAYEAGLRIPDDLGQVFLVSARRAFDASSFIRVREQYGPQAWDTPEGQTLGRAAFTDHWPGIRDMLPESALNATPRKVWDNSGFGELLDRSLLDLQRQAGPLVLRSALNQCQGITGRLSSYLRVRSAAVNKDAASLRFQRQELEADRKAVAQVRKDLNISRKQRNALQNKVDKLINKRRNQVREIISAGVPEKSSEEPDNPIARLLGPIQSLFQSLGDFLPLLGQDGARGTRNFKTADEARSFLTKLSQAFVSQVALVNGELQREVVLLVAETEENLRVELRNRAEPIVVKAQQRLEDEFRVTLTLPVPVFADTAGTFEVPDHEAGAVKVPQKIRRRVMKRRWFTLWLFKVPTTEVIKLPDVIEYVIDLDKLVEDYLGAFDYWLGQLRGSIRTIVLQDIDDSLADYFEKLDHFLERYMASIQGGIDAEFLDHEKQLRLIEAFGQVLAHADQEQAEAHRLLGYLEDFEVTMAGQE